MSSYIAIIVSCTISITDTHVLYIHRDIIRNQNLFKGKECTHLCHVSTKSLAVFQEGKLSVDSE